MSLIYLDGVPELGERSRTKLWVTFVIWAEDGWALPFELKDCVLTGYDSHNGEEKYFSKYILYVATAVQKLCYVSALTSNF